MTASKATLCAGVTRGKRRVWPSSTWCSSCITRTKRCASVSAVLLDEARVDAQDGAALAADAGGGDVLARLDAEELQERAQGVAARGDGVEDAADEVVGFGGGGHRDSSGKKRTRAASGRRATARGGETAGRAAPSGARGRRGPRRAGGSGPMSTSDVLVEEEAEAVGHAGLRRACSRWRSEDVLPAPRSRARVVAEARRRRRRGGPRPRASRAGPAVRAASTAWPVARCYGSRTRKRRPGMERARHGDPRGRRARTCCGGRVGPSSFRGTGWTGPSCRMRLGTA